MVNSNSSKVPEIDMSLESWIYNIRSTLQSPLTILTVTALLVSGTFAETAPRKSIEFFDTSFGRAILFIIPLIMVFWFDWSTGLLAATVSLIVFTKLQKSELDEGYMDSPESDNSDLATKIISSPHRWFVEKVLGETPIAISSDRIRTSTGKDENQRTSSSLSSNNTSSASGSAAHSELSELISSSSSSK